jgi:hypothetical protein
MFSRFIDLGRVIDLQWTKEKHILVSYAIDDQEAVALIKQPHAVTFAKDHLAVGDLAVFQGETVTTATKRHHNSVIRFIEKITIVNKG